MDVKTETLLMFDVWLAPTGGLLPDVFQVRARDRDHACRIVAAEISPFEVSVVDVVDRRWR